MIYPAFAFTERIRLNGSMKRCQPPPDVVLVWVSAALRFRFPACWRRFRAQLQAIQIRQTVWISALFSLLLLPDRLQPGYPWSRPSNACHPPRQFPLPSGTLNPMRAHKAATGYSRFAKMRCRRDRDGCRGRTVKRLPDHKEREDRAAKKPPTAKRREQVLLSLMGD